MVTERLTTGRPAADGSASHAAGDVDVAAVGAVLAEPARARILMALADGRELPASVLAAEAGVAASTASHHLGRLVDAGLVAVRRYGRHRYHSLSGPAVGELLEVLTRLAPTTPVRSLRQGTRARALRAARTCYDHLAGELGVAVFASMISRGEVTGGDGRHHPAQVSTDRFSAPGHDVDYRLTREGWERLTGIGAAVPPWRDGGPALRYCVDWSEQAHHLSGVAGRSLATRLFELGWLRRAERGRALYVTDEGRTGLANVFGLSAGLR